MKTALIIILVLVLLAGGVYVYMITGGRSFGNKNSDGLACTMDAKLCSDGSYVGRVGPRCEFAPCPSSSTNGGAVGIVGTVITSTTSNTTTVTSTGTIPKSLTVTYTDSGFSPKTAVIAKGGKITFVNKSSARMRVASDPHPSHTDYPDFDQEATISTDGTWTFTFNKIGSWGYHDHLNPGMTGTVIVE